MRDKSKDLGNKNSSEEKEIRVYDLATEFNCSSKELLKLMGERGIQVTNHMSRVSISQANALRRFYFVNRTTADINLKANKLQIEEPIQFVNPPEEDLIDINISKINALIVRFNSIRALKIDIKDRLMGLFDAEAENYIDPGSLNSSAEELLKYLRLQEEVFEEMVQIFPGYIVKNYSTAIKTLQDAKVKAEAKESLTTLTRFRQIAIDNADADNADVEPLLIECKKRALELIQIKEGEVFELELLAYQSFLKVVDNPKISLTKNEEEAIENKFPRPIPRLLYQGKFYLATYDSQQLVESINAQPELIEINKEEARKVKPSLYSFKTVKEGTPFQAKEILSYLRKPDIAERIKLLSMLNNCQIVSAEQFVRWIYQSENLLEYYIKPLIKNGCVTKIKEIGKEDEYYCLSAKGVLMFTKKSITDEFNKRNWAFQQTSVRPFREREDLINKTLLLNEIALQIIYDRNKVYSKDYLHRETKLCQIPYLTFSTPKKDYLLITEGNRQEGTTEEIKDILNNCRLDVLVYLPIYDSDKNAWGILNNLPIDTSCCFIARIKDKEITYLDTEGNCLDSIVQDEYIDEPEGIKESEDSSAPPTEETISKGTDSICEKTCANGSDSDFVEEDSGKDQEVNGRSSAINLKPRYEEQSELANIETSSSSHIAKQMLEYLNKPDFTYKRDFREPDFALLITKLLSENEIIEACVLAKALSFVKEKAELGKFYNRLLAAVNLSMDPHKYTGLSLSNLDADEASIDVFNSALLMFLRLSCFAWALIIPDEQNDYNLYNHKPALLNYVDDLEQIDVLLDKVSGEMKQMFAILFDLENVSRYGFSSKVLTNFISEENRKNQQMDLIKRAEELLIEPSIRQRLTGVPELLSSCFGNKSNLYKCMKIICDSEFEQKSFVEGTLAFFSEFQSENELGKERSYMYSEQKIKGYIDKSWKSVNTKLPALKYSPRNTVTFGIKKRLDIICEWLEITNDNSQKLPDSIYSNLNETRNQLLNMLKSLALQLDKLCDSFEVPVQAGVRVLTHTFNKLQDYLETGVSPHEKWEYIGLLSSYQINLDKEYKPNIISKMQEIPGFEPWRRVLEHIVSPKYEPLEAISMIDDPKESNWYSNYGTAEHLNLYLFETIERPIDDLSQTFIAAQQLAEKYEEDFKSEFELKYAYGCIEESTKESIFQIASLLSDFFKESVDIAQYRVFLDTLLNNSNKETKELENRLTSRMVQIKFNDGLTNESTPILRNIERNLLNKNLAVAEEYLNRLDRGELSIPEEELEIDKETDYHKVFLNEYDKLYRICQENRGNAMKNWGYNSIESELRLQWTARSLQNSERFINSWPIRKDAPGNSSAVANLLKFMGFVTGRPERHPQEEKSDKYNYYRVKVTPTQINLRDYPHPIASFGTLMNSYIDVVCLFGSNSANELINIMTNRLQLGGNTIVLMDGALSLIDRRKVAEQFKSQTSGQNSFLLIDRVLMLYLATLDEGERLVAMLKCTLPYTFYQPFSKDGGAIADEMFFGRKAELNDILLPTGSCLVYGGRQLGKTALLERAKSIAHQPHENKYALYIYIYRQFKEGLVRCLNEELLKTKLLKKECRSLEEICQELEDAFCKGQIVQLQLFIDETDDFLEEASKDNYAVLQPLLNLKRNTKNQFKFVLAGLHNVARSRHALQNNGLLPQLGAPLCIKPLSPADAKKLVERLLSYLGFQMGEQQLALILANTNYYPGILHFFCYTLVQSVSDKYKMYYSVSEGNPPYSLKDDQLKTIFASEDLNNRIKEKLYLTLDLDTRYKLIANVLAYMNYEDERNEVARLQGYYDIKDILRNIEDIPHPNNLRQPELESLLYEMAEMGILSSKPNSKLFRFRKNSFLGLIGGEDDVLEALLGGSEGGEL